MRPGSLLAAVALCLTGCGSGADTTALPPDGANVQAVVARNAAPPLIVAFGDSLYAGYGLPAAAGLAPALERRLRATGMPAQVVTASVSGSSAAGHARLEATPDGLDRQPALVLADRIHPSAAGVDRIAANLVGPVSASLSEARRR